MFTLNKFVEDFFYLNIPNVTIKIEVVFMVVNELYKLLLSISTGIYIHFQISRKESIKYMVWLAFVKFLCLLFQLYN